MSRYSWLLLVGVLTFGADQVTKYLAVGGLTTALEGTQGAERVKRYFTAHNLDNLPIVPGQPYKLQPPVVLFQDFWHFRYVENPGAAWGMFGQLPESVRRPFFHLVSLAALVFILTMFRKLPANARLVQLALSLVLGGALGNFFDRLVRGYVIDFIDWHWRNQPNLRWPTFNVADAAICVGVALLLLDSLRRKPEEQASGQAAPSALPVTPEGESAGN